MDLVCAPQLLIAKTYLLLADPHAAWYRAAFRAVSRGLRRMGVVGLRWRRGPAWQVRCDCLSMCKRCCRFYWGCDPISYAQRALAINEFAAPRWQNMKLPSGESVGNTILDQRDIPHEQWWIWCAPSALTAPCEAFFLEPMSVVNRFEDFPSYGEIMGAQLTDNRRRDCNCNNCIYRG